MLHVNTVWRKNLLTGSMELPIWIYEDGTWFSGQLPSALFLSVLHQVKGVKIDRTWCKEYPNRFLLYITIETQSGVIVIIATQVSAGDVGQFILAMCLLYMRQLNPSISGIEYQRV